MTIELTVAIGLFCSVLGAGIAMANQQRTTRKDAAAEGRNGGVVLTELGYIKSGIDDLKRKQEQTDEKHLSLATRMAAVEASAKQAHRRMDDHARLEHHKEIDRRDDS